MTSTTEISNSRGWWKKRVDKSEGGEEFQGRVNNSPFFKEKRKKIRSAE